MVYDCQNVCVKPGRPPKKTTPGELGALLSTLRRGRGISQDTLSELAKVDRETIARVEQGRGQWNRSTARRIYDALNADHPLREEDARKLLELSQLDPDLYTPPSVQTPRAAPAPYEDPLINAAAPLIRQIAAVIGFEKTIAMLQGSAIALGYTTGPQTETSPLIHRSPPINRPNLGAVEVVETEYPRPQESFRERRRAQS